MKKVIVWKFKDKKALPWCQGGGQSMDRTSKPTLAHSSTPQKGQGQGNFFQGYRVVPIQEMHAVGGNEEFERKWFLMRSEKEEGHQSISACFTKEKLENFCLPLWAVPSFHISEHASAHIHWAHQVLGHALHIPAKTLPAFEKMYINYWLFKRKRPSFIENTWWKLPEGHYSFVKAMLVHHVFTNVATMIHARDGWIVPIPHPNDPQCRYQEENLNLGDPFQWCWSWWVKMQKTIDNFPNYWHLHSENSKHQPQFWTV